MAVAAVGGSYCDVAAAAVVAAVVAADVVAAVADAVSVAPSGMCSPR